MNKIQEKIIEVCLKIAKRREGALIVFGALNKEFYKPLVEQTVKPFDILKNGKLFESICLMDGAVIIDKNGRLVAYGVQIKSSRIFKEMGTRHSAGVSVSYKRGVISFVVSEEDNKIRVFNNGKIIMQIDSTQKNIEKKVSEISNMLESVGVGTLGVIGASSLGVVGITLVPGVIIFGSLYYLIKKFGLTQ